MSTGTVLTDTIWTRVSRGKVLNDTLAERIAGAQDALQPIQPEVVNYCPRCGKKNNGGHYCTHVEQICLRANREIKEIEEYGGMRPDLL